MSQLGQAEPLVFRFNLDATPALSAVGLLCIRAFPAVQSFLHSLVENRLQQRDYSRANDATERASQPNVPDTASCTWKDEQTQNQIASDPYKPQRRDDPDVLREDRMDAVQ